MGVSLKEVKPLSGFRLELFFHNGSYAVVNMEKRIKTMRFSQLSSETVFATAKAEGDKVVWINGNRTFGVYCGELLDAMMLD